MTIKMTRPLELELLLHAVCIRAEFPRRGAPEVEVAIRSLVTAGAVTLCPEPNMIRATELGEKWLAAILRTPAPQQVWVDAEGSPL